MKPKIEEGDVVVVHKQADADTGNVVIASINGEEATCKKLRKTDNGIFLMPTNNDYEPMFFSNDEIELLPVKILGKVVELRAKF
jgi:repressor LexA